MHCPNCKTESGPSLFCYVCDAYLPSMSAGTKASIPSRLGAYLLDLIVLVILLAIFGLIAMGAGVSVSSLYRDHGLEVFLIIFFGGWLCYFLVFFSLLGKGQTPGKWFMDIRAVEKRNGSEPGLGRMLLRETLGKWVSGCFFGLGWFWAIWDRDAQAWHDKIVRTVVLYRRTESSKSPAFAFLFGALVISGFFAWATFAHASKSNLPQGDEESTPAKILPRESLPVALPASVLGFRYGESALDVSQRAKFLGYSAEGCQQSARYVGETDCDFEGGIGNSIQAAFYNGGLEKLDILSTASVCDAILKEIEREHGNPLANPDGTFWWGSSSDGFSISLSRSADGGGNFEISFLSF